MLNMSINEQIILQAGIVLFALILTLKVSAAVTGDPIGKQLYVATHTSDISTTEEIRQVMQEADEIWP